jgi:hypothetical protein
MNKPALIIIVVILLIIAYFMLPDVTGLVTGLLVSPDADDMPETYCGNGECDDDEDCGNCAMDCGLCRLLSRDVSVEMEWRDLYNSGTGELCGEYDRGSVYGMIKLSDEIGTGVYFCTINFTDTPQNSWSIRSPGIWNLFARDLPLKQDHPARFCCHSYSSNPDFCKTIIMNAYC